MKKSNPSNDNFPFIKDKKHIYNLLDEQGFQTVDIGWSVLTFELLPEIRSEGDDCDGLTDFSGKSIKLSMNLDDLEARETIIHELMHCMLETLGMHESHFNSDLLRTTNEVLALTLSKQQIVFDRLNPGLYTLLNDLPTKNKSKRS